MAMNLINSIVLVGNITRDAEIKYFNSGACVVQFSIAQNKRIKKGEDWVDDPQFFDIKFFGKGAEAVHKYLTKGKQVGVQGELDQEKWQQEGQNRSKMVVKAFELQLLGGQPTGQKDEPIYKVSESAQKAANAFGGSVVHDGSFEDDVPF
jgi:single-strand DNA-binding protein